MPAENASQLRRRASALRATADAIEASGFAALRVRAGSNVWIGPTASACLDDLATHHGALRRAADELRSDASAVAARADVLDARAQT